MVRGILLLLPLLNVCHDNNDFPKMRTKKHHEEVKTTAKAIAKENEWLRVKIARATTTTTNQTIHMRICEKCDLTFGIFKYNTQ